MRALLTLYLGIFSVMALSNAIVPDLDSYAPGTAMQGQIFSAYFLGAFLLTLPVGILSDRWGQRYFIQAGLFLTVVSGILLSTVPSASVYMMIFARLVEGAGAGLFIASAMSYVNSRVDHTRSSGYFMALLNIGLVAGLLLSGLAIKITGYRQAGVVIFLVISMIPFVASLFSSFDSPKALRPVSGRVSLLANLAGNTRKYFWMWFSAVVLIGITGAVTALYPDYSGSSPEIIAVQIAAMNGATALAVILVSRVKFDPVPTIRIAALFSAAAVITSYFTSWAFIIIGLFAGIIMIAQLAFLADAGPEQGIFMGLFNTSSYLGMSILPFIVTYIAEISGFFQAFLVCAVCCLIVAATIGFCIQCRVEKSCTLSSK